MKHRTPAYWPTRIILAVGVIATALVIVFARTLIVTAPDCFSCYNPDVLGVPSNVLRAGFAVGLAVVGLIWMLRIFRGPRDEPHTWRYRR